MVLGPQFAHACSRYTVLVQFHSLTEKNQKYSYNGMNCSCHHASGSCAGLRQLHHDNAKEMKLRQPTDWTVRRSQVIIEVTVASQVCSQAHSELTFPVDRFTLSWLPPPRSNLTPAKAGAVCLKLRQHYYLFKDSLGVCHHFPPPLRFAQTLMKRNN